jgi:hypothetical protein
VALGQGFLGALRFYTASIITEICPYSSPRFPSSQTYGVEFVAVLIWYERGTGTNTNDSGEAITLGDLIL